MIDFPFNRYPSFFHSVCILKRTINDDIMTSYRSLHTASNTNINDFKFEQYKRTSYLCRVNATPFMHYSTKINTEPSLPLL